MFETFQTIINAGDYALEDITGRIKTMYAMGELSEDEMKQLLDQAQTNANPDASLPDLETRIGNLELRVAALEKEHEEPVSEDEYPAYVQPTSKDGYYNKGDKMTFTDGKHYTCVKNNVANGPDIEPKSWQLEE